MLWFNPDEASVNRVEAQKFILSAVKRGISGAETIGVLQKADTWYDSRQFGEDWGHWKTAVSQGSRMAFVNKNARPSDSLYSYNRGLSASKYQTVMEIRGRDLETGDAFTQDVTVLHTHTVDGLETIDQQQLYTRQELEDLAERYLDWYGLRDTIEVDAIVPVMGYINPEI